MSDLAASLPYTTSSFTRMVYLELIAELVNHVSKKYFCNTFLDAYYLLSKDKCSNIIIKFSNIAHLIYKKVGYEDSRNKERMINIMKGLMDSDKIKPYVKEFVAEGYKKMIGLPSLSAAEKAIRDEEEEKFVAHEKSAAKSNKMDIYKEKRTFSNGLSRGASGGSGKFSGRVGTGDQKPGIPKTASKSNFKKSLKKKKEKKDTSSKSDKPKAKKSDKAAIPLPKKK